MFSTQHPYRNLSLLKAISSKSLTCIGTYKMAILNADVWQFEDAQPDLSFNEQLNFIADMRPFIERDLA